MKLDKKAKSVIAVYSIILVVYVLAFLIVPFNKVAASWISFVFTVVAFLASLVICGIAFKEKETLVSKIYGFPVFRIGVIYAVAQFVIGIVVCVIAALDDVPSWVALLISVILFAAAVIGVIVTDNTRDVIEAIDESVKTETKNITFFQIDIAGIVDNCENAELKSELKALNELFQFSDPVTNDATKESEEMMKAMLSELKALIADGESDEIKVMIKKITNLLNERNRICKANK